LSVASIAWNIFFHFSCPSVFSKIRFQDQKASFEADKWLLGAGHQWTGGKKGCPMGPHGRGNLLLLGGSMDVTEKKESTHGGRWARNKFM